MANEEVDRRAEILNAAVELFGTLGYYGTSLQKIADRVGLTKAGVLHYVGSKEGLLTAALDEVYDSETEDILTDIVREPRPLIADMWRRIVAVNARRPLQVHMFSTLSAEAIDRTTLHTSTSPIVSCIMPIPRSISVGVCPKALIRVGCLMRDSP